MESKDKKPKDLTIIVPAHNREHTLPRTLASIKAQTLRPLSVILVDNASTDGTLVAMQRWAQENSSDDFTVKVITEQKPGASAARNAGLNACLTEWTMFFDSDDEMSPDHAKHAMACLDEHPNADIVGWDVEMLIGKKRKKVRFHRFDLIFHCIAHGAMSTQRYMARTSLFRKVGGWREDVMVWNDIELGVRMLLVEPTPMIYKRTAKPEVTVHVSADSITGPSFSSRSAEREHSIDCIEESLPAKYKWMAALKRAVLAGNYKREGEKEKAEALADKIKCDKPMRTWLCRMAYRYTGIGGRGAAAIVNELIL